MITIQVLAGDLPKGKQRLDPKLIKATELQTEEKLKKLAGSAGWGFAGAIVGGLLTGGLGLAVGGLAGIMSGGNKTEVCFSCELEDGRKFLAITKKKNWQNILAASFEKNQSNLAQTPNENVSAEQGEISSESNNDLLGQTENHHSDDLPLEPTLNELQQSLESVLAKYGVTIQVNQSIKQLTIVINRNEKVLVEYLKLAEIATQILNTYKLKGFTFTGAKQVKIIGRATGESSAEWQRILVLSSNGEEFESLHLSGNNTSHSHEQESHTDLMTTVSSLVGSLWRWYVSGFASRPDLPMYAAPRFYRILLTVFAFLFITSPFGVPDKIFNQESITSSESNTVGLGTAGPTLCVKNFNEVMGSSASATHSRGDTAINVMVYERVSTEAEANQIASKFADSIFRSCSLVDSVDISFDGFSGALVKNRP